MSSLPVQQISGIYHRKIGDVVVTAVSDGYIDGNLDLLKNVEVDQARAILVDAFRPVRRVSINAFLVHTKGGLVLIDTGTGGSMGATNGWIGRNLAAAGRRCEGCECRPADAYASRSFRGSHRHQHGEADISER